MWTVTIAVFCFVSAFVLASLVEYWVHRLMHVSPTSVLVNGIGIIIGQIPGRGVLWEFLDYIKGTFIALFLLFFVSWQAGIAWFLGGIVYAAFSAYAHQLQHENPIKCFWMKMPVHYVHHKYGMWNHNFGLAVDWWDHVFGTYKPVDWLTEEELSRPPSGYLEVQWW